MQNYGPHHNIWNDLFYRVNGACMLCRRPCKGAPFRALHPERSFKSSRLFVLPSSLSSTYLITSPPCLPFSFTSFSHSLPSLPRTHYLYLSPRTVKHVLCCLCEDCSCIFLYHVYYIRTELCAGSWDSSQLFNFPQINCTLAVLYDHY